MGYGLPSGHIEGPTPGKLLWRMGWGESRIREGPSPGGPFSVSQERKHRKYGMRVGECPVTHQRAFPAGGQGVGNHRTGSTDRLGNRQHRQPPLGEVRLYGLWYPRKYFKHANCHHLKPDSFILKSEISVSLNLLEDLNPDFL